MLPADKLMIDNTIVVFRSFIILFALIIPITPTGIPASNIRTLPKIPIVSSRLNKELEFKIFVGVLDHQIIKGITKTNVNCNPKIILLKTVLFSLISKVPPFVKFLFVKPIILQNNIFFNKEIFFVIVYKKGSFHDKGKQ